MIEQFWLANKLRFTLATEEDTFQAVFSGEAETLNECKLIYSPVYDEETMQDHSLEREFHGFRAKIEASLSFHNNDEKGNFLELLTILTQYKPIKIDLDFDENGESFTLENMWLDSDIGFEKIFRAVEAGQDLPAVSFISKNLIPDLPLKSINWDGYNEGPYNEGLYNA
jgi:hypothetical protein